MKLKFPRLHSMTITLPLELSVCFHQVNISFLQIVFFFFTIQRLTAPVITEETAKSFHIPDVHFLPGVGKLYHFELSLWLEIPPTCVSAVGSLRNVFG
jgi:hypothetical protein